MLNVSRLLSRIWITPGPKKGWIAGNFESMGEAMRVARTSKKYTFGKLSRGTEIAPKTLWSIEKGLMAPSNEELKKIELYLGVPILARRK